MITLDTLEISLLELQKKITPWDHYLEIKKPRSQKEIVESARLFPELKITENICRLMIEQCSTHTEEFGHSARADRVKNRVFEILGRIIGEDL